MRKFMKTGIATALGLTLSLSMFTGVFAQSVQQSSANRAVVAVVTTNAPDQGHGNSWNGNQWHRNGWYGSQVHNNRWLRYRWNGYRRYGNRWLRNRWSHYRGYANHGHYTYNRWQ